MSRRSLLVALAGATAMAACGTIRGEAPASVSSRNSAPDVTLGLQADIPAAAIAAFQRTHPTVHFATGAVSRSVRYQITEFSAGGAPLSLGVCTDLTAALRALNLDADAYLPGTMTFWTDRGHILAVPCSELPWGVVWRTDAFATAGLSAPAADWTLSDFQDACTALQGLAASGSVKGLRAALGPMAPQGLKGPATGALMFPGLWQAFVWGFGGTIVANGAFALTDAKTVAAIQTLCDLVNQFSVPDRYIPSLPSVSAFTSWRDEVFSLFGMTFQVYSEAPLPPAYKWARLPRFPVSPTIPVLSSAIALQASAPGAALPSSTSPEAVAASQFGAWLNSGAGVQSLASEGIPPATARASSQLAFWSGRGPGGAAVVGDWASFRSVYDGFPVIPPQDFVSAAIAAVVEGTASSSAALAGAQQQMNALLPTQA